MNMGIIVGVVVLLVCIGFVVLMMVSEWSESKENTQTAPATGISKIENSVKMVKKSKAKAVAKAKKKSVVKKKKRS
jgi:predicted secreted protein